MSRPQKILTTLLWVLAIAALGGFLVAKAHRQVDEVERKSDELPVLAQVPHFELVDQNNKPFTNETIRGKLWVADFIFTTCGQACPMMSAKMAKLQKAIPDKEVHLV